MDTTGNNIFRSLDPLNTFDFKLGAGDTGLVILQPKIPNIIPPTPDLEVRGYVEIFVTGVISSPSFPSFPPAQSYPLLLTPEHRGTFFPPNPPANAVMEFDQLITSLPTATGGALMDVDVIS